MNSTENQTKSSNESVKKDYVSDFDYSLRYVRGILQFLGIWPLVVYQPTKIEYILSKNLSLPLTSLSMLSLAMPLWYYVIACPIDRFETIIWLGPSTHLMSNILVYFVIILRASLIKSCIEHIKLDWQRIEDSKEYDIMTQYMRISHTLTITCLICMYSGGILYGFIMPLFTGDTINAMNETMRPRPLPGTEIFLDIQTDPVYEIVFFVNFISALQHISTCVGVCVLDILFVSHACGQIQIIVSNLGSFISRINDDKIPANLITKELGFVIRRHVRLLKFVVNIEKTTKEMLFLEVVAITLIMCFVEYDILITLESDSGDSMGVLTYVLLFISFALNLFMYCLFGEVLKGQCEKIGKKAYLFEWSDLPGRTQLSLIMIINISNYPYKLTAGGFMDLSIVNFVSILKTSFAYFNMLRTTN